METMGGHGRVGTNAVRGWVLSLASAAALAAPAVHAMTLEVRDNIVFATGPVVEDDFKKFTEIFAKPGTDTIVFVNSPGGDLNTSLTVGRLIAARNYKTVAAGACMSACSIMFLGGRERRFADAFRPGLTMVGIHGAHRRISKIIDPQFQPQLFAYYKARMGPGFDADAINKALYEMDDPGAFLRIPDSIRNPRAVPFFCRSALTPRRDCINYDGKDALSMGVVTSTEIAKVDLPDAFKVKARLLGKELIDTVPASPVYMVDLVNTICPTEVCKQGVTDWVVRPENRALALRRDGKGIAANWNRDTPITSFVSAIYACNHLRNQPIGLCEARIVNNTDVRFMYEEAESGHREALAQLKPPAQKTYAAEDQGGVPLWGNQLRTQRLQDMTPQRVEGVRNITTQELATLLAAPVRPEVIDVWGGATSVIPGSEVLLYGGNAFDDATRDADYAKRFEGLLAQLAPDKTRPLVFYTKGRDNWMAINAALRALKAGYVDVAWYRGGIDAWNAARLPTAPIAIRAVTN